MPKGATSRPNNRTVKKLLSSKNKKVRAMGRSMATGMRDVRKMPMLGGGKTRERPTSRTAAVKRGARMIADWDK